MTDTNTIRYRPKAGFVLEQVDDELLIYHPSEALVVYCNPTAALVWQLCDGRRDAAQIADLLADAFPQQRATVLCDVREALAQLSAQEAIEAVDTARAVDGFEDGDEDVAEHDNDGAPRATPPRPHEGNYVCAAGDAGASGAATP